MPLFIVRNDITKMKVDAIVNAANSTLLGGGGVDGCIHRAAGPGLLKECRTLGGCAPGEAKITQVYDLPCKYIIHTVGPVWRGGRHNEENTLISCYKNSLELALKYNCDTIAFPLISSGIFGYPKDKALCTATNTIKDFLSQNDMTVYIVIFDKDSFISGKKLFPDIHQYIDDNYVKHTQTQFPRNRLNEEIEHPYSLPLHTNITLEDELNSIDESFSEMLLRKIDECHMTDAKCYKKANISRKHFSKIRGNKNYKPGKATVLAFAIALELSLDETKELLMKAGFALSRSNKSDIIIEYFIKKGNYNIFEINEALFTFDQRLLGE